MAPEAIALLVSEELSQVLIIVRISVRKDLVEELFLRDSRILPSITPSGVVRSLLWRIKPASMEPGLMVRVPLGFRVVFWLTKLMKPGSLNVSFDVVVSKVAIVEPWTLPTAPIFPRVRQFPVVVRKVLTSSAALTVGRSEMRELDVILEKVVRLVVSEVGFAVVANL